MIMLVGKDYMQLIIKRPTLKQNGVNTRLIADIEYGNEIFSLWYEVNNEFGEFFCEEYSDSFLIALLPWAMMRAKKEKKRIEIMSEQVISEQLYHQVNNYYIPVLCKDIPYYGEVDILPNFTNTCLSSLHAVGTGISGGVDSSYTIAKYTNCIDKSFRLTHGVFFNIGIYGGYESDSEKNLEQKALNIANKTGIKYIKITSNTCVDLYAMAHAPIVPFIFMAGVLSLQKLFSVYYYSSGFCADDFHISDIDAAYFDLLSVNCFKTENTSFYSSGIEATRLQKVDFISEYDFTFDNLSVCLSEEQGLGNCCRCAKCTRTMAELETLGKLDRYKRVFDVAEFRNHPAYHWGYILLKSKSDSFCKEIVEVYRKRFGRIPFVAYLGSMKKWVLRGFTSTNRKRKRVNE
jgi:hypothetical protein